MVLIPFTRECFPDIQCYTEGVFRVLRNGEGYLLRLGTQLGDVLAQPKESECLSCGEGYTKNSIHRGIKN